VGEVAPQDAHRLFVTEGSTITQAVPWAAIGAGQFIAHQLLSRLHPYERLDRWTATILAAFVLYLVKDSVAGCGRFTHIVH